MFANDPVMTGWITNNKEKVYLEEVADMSWSKTNSIFLKGQQNQGAGCGLLKKAAEGLYTP